MGAACNKTRSAIRWIVAGFAISLFASASYAQNTHLDTDLSDLVTLFGGCEDQEVESINYSRIFPDGTSQSGFTIPDDKTLVLTDVEWTASDFNNVRFRVFSILLYPAGVGDPSNFVSVFRSDAARHFDFAGFGLNGFGGNYTEGLAQNHQHMTAGVVIGSGYSFDPAQSTQNVYAAFGAPKPLFCNVILRGYLASNAKSKKNK